MTDAPNIAERAPFELSARTQVLLKEADHVQAIMGRHDQGFAALKAAYLTALTALCIFIASMHAPKITAASAVLLSAFFFTAELISRIRFWAGWARRIVAISAELQTETPGAYTLIGGSDIEDPRWNWSPRNIWDRLVMSKNISDIFFYLASAGLAMMLLRALGA